MNKAELLARLRALPWDPAEYWLVAGGAMVLYGLREQTHDVDLGCSTKLADALQAQGCPFRRAADGKRSFRPDDGLELFEGWLCGSVVPVDGVPVVSLRGLLEMKQALGREKDRKDAALILKRLAENGASDREPPREEAGLLRKGDEDDDHDPTH